MIAYLSGKPLGNDQIARIENENAQMIVSKLLDAGLLHPDELPMLFVSAVATSWLWGWVVDRTQRAVCRRHRCGAS